MNVTPVNKTIYLLLSDIFAKYQTLFFSKVNLLRILVIAIFYYFSGQASFSISVSHDIVTLVIFAAEGFALAAILLWGYQVWPGIFLGQFILALVNNLAPEIAAGISLINSLEALLAYYLFKKLNVDICLNHFKDVAGLVALIFLVLQVFSATLGVGLLWSVDSIKNSDLSVSWFSWWFGNSMGQLLITPFLLTLSSHVFKRNLLTTRTLLIAVLFASSLFFAMIWLDIKNIALVFAIVIPLMVIISRLWGMIVSTFITTVITVIVLSISGRGLGPFVEQGELHILELNLFLLGTALGTLFLSVLFSEREQFELEQQQFIDIIDNYVLTLSTDLKGNIVKISKAFCNLNKYSKTELIGKHYKILSHPDTEQSVFDELRTKLLNGEEWHGEVQNQAKDGESYWLSINLAPLHNSLGQQIGYTAVSENITARKIIEVFSVTDQLTKLYNRHKLNQVFQYEIDQAARYAKIFSIILIDIDYFKDINDNFGHQMGDDFLKQFAKILDDSVRNVDTLCRWGGEEFLVICPETNAKGALSLANKISKNVENNYFKKIGYKTCSIGLTEFVISDTPETMFKRADAALFFAKQSGRNRCEVL